ncbi:MAG: 50S ribosomal protein L1 [Candidatus Gracilibacteria bacterium]|nr:50S ribosomal protein L1 [Candidatus Gracilibacteria bacterium]
MAGKKLRKVLELVDQNAVYSMEDAIELIEKTNTVKFDATVEIHFNLNLDPKYQDQMIRVTTSLPNGTGKKVKVCVFTETKIEEAKKAGATVAGGEELIEQIAQGKQALDFDICVATPDMMRKLGKIARQLGPKGLMPNPKTGTVGDDVEAIVKEIAAGRVELRTDKQGNIHTILGKVSFGKEKLVQNLEHVLNFVKEVKPSGSKGKYINSVYVCNTMGPGIKLATEVDAK